MEELEEEDQPLNEVEEDRGPRGDQDQGRQLPDGARGDQPDGDHGDLPNGDLPKSKIDAEEVNG